MSIWIRKKQAEKQSRRLLKEQAGKRRKPALYALSLPEDLTENGMRLILMGDRRALVENCLDVVEISKEQIRLRTRSGILGFQGSGLLLEDVRPGSLAVVGRIESVQLPRDVSERSGSQ